MATNKLNPRFCEKAPSDAIEAVYNDAKHYKERQQMMQHWANYLDALRKYAEVLPSQMKTA